MKCLWSPKAIFRVIRHIGERFQINDIDIFEKNLQNVILKSTAIRKRLTKRLVELYKESDQ